MSKSRAPRPLDAVLRDSALLDEIRVKFAAGGGTEIRSDVNLDRVIEALNPRRGVDPRGSMDAATEAIVMRVGRPSFVVRSGRVELPASGVWLSRLTPDLPSIGKVIPSVGRVEVTGVPDFDWLGTAWLVDENLVVTNRHVAKEFTTRDAAGKPVFASAPLGGTATARIDFLEEFRQTAPAQQVQVLRVVYVAPDGANFPDVALLELARSDGLPEPLSLSDRDAKARDPIATIGYPAFDSRNGADAIRDYFGEILDVKRFAPGEVMESDPTLPYLLHDCTTLGGASGSPVFERSTGRVVGLHFAGSYLRSNYAVRASALRRVIADEWSRSIVPVSPIGVPAGGGGDSEGPSAHGAAFFEGRTGYDEDFLGAGFRVPLPDYSVHANDAAGVKGGGQVLRYQHFSVVMSESRRLPRLTAVNIDGLNARRIPRGNDVWFLDDRIARSAQVGNELYQNNEFDRGHQVRREDPNWGVTREEAVLANEDTFHYTNSCPQHADLNQKEWLGLEDYVLSNTKQEQMRVSVFTGPVLRDDDPKYRDVRIPREYWKVAVVVDTDTNRAVATGYILSQAGLVRDVIDSEFVFGPYKTYQVAVSAIETKTGLRFGSIARNDPFEARMRSEGRGDGTARRIHNLGDIVLR